MSTIPNVDLISLCTAALAASRDPTGALETRCYYASTSRSALAQIEERCRVLRLNLEAVEKELIRLAKANEPPEPKKMVGKERGV